MKTLLVVLVLLAAGFVGLGFYRGWFSITSDGADAKSHVTLSVDKDKMRQDENTAIGKAQGLGHKVKDTAATPAEKCIDGTVVRVTSDKLTMTNKEGKEHRYTLAADVKVTCDGMVCKAADLKPGMRLRVTTLRDDPTRVEALDKNRDFEEPTQTP